MRYQFNSAERLQTCTPNRDISKVPQPARVKLDTPKLNTKISDWNIFHFHAISRLTTINFESCSCLKVTFARQTS